MRILALSDVEESWFSRMFDRRRFEGVDLIISCGDLSAGYLEFIADMVNKPVAYVAGNHDANFEFNPPAGCIDLDGQISDYHGLRICGLGGSFAYNDRVYGFSEVEMRRHVSRMVLMAQATGGVDLVVTHAPAAGYGDLDDYAHQGFECFNTLLDKMRPINMLFGHVHAEYGADLAPIEHPSGAILCNCYGHRYIDIPDDWIPERKRSFWFGVDKL